MSTLKNEIEDKLDFHGEMQDSGKPRNRDIHRQIAGHLEDALAAHERGDKFGAEQLLSKANTLEGQHGLHKDDLEESVSGIIEAIDQLDELHPFTLKSYKIKAKAQERAANTARIKAKYPEDAAEFKAISNKRAEGIRLANRRMTKESLESMVSAVLDGDQESASAAFGLAMGERLTDKMDAMKIEIASTLTK